MNDPLKNNYTWQAHPARERSAKALLAGSIIIALSIAAWGAFGHIGFSLLAGTVLILSLNRFFFRSTFTITHEHIIAEYPLRTKRLRLVDIRRFVHDEHGGFLSTRSRTSRMDAYSGMHILFGDHREAVIQRIAAQLPAVQEAPPCPA